MTRDNSDDWVYGPRMKPLGLLLAALLLLGGCGYGGSVASGGCEAFPADTAQDWVTYGDYLVELEVVSEETLPPDENELFEGEGLFRRQFTLTTEKVWWARPGVKHRAPTRHQQVSGGWQFKNGDLKHRHRLKDPDQLEVGQHHLIIFTHDAELAAEGSSEWWGFGRLSIKSGRLDPVQLGGDRPIDAQLSGRTPAEAAALLKRTGPDPDVVPYLDEDARDRYQHGVGDQLPPGTPAPGER